ncbi:MAG: hypothetical protein HRU69_05090 [Flammeovirgaceae bacterium]|nr:MAG: hypothetical protein HRU69_05090 [Flammeovirgaceae bacterium]
MKLHFLISLLLISGAASAHPGVGIVMDSKGNVFYTDLKQVWKIDTQGRKSVAVRNVHTHELYMDESDNLYGEHLWYNGERLDTWGHYVWKYSADGRFEKIIPDTEGFLSNYSFVRDHHGNMYWAHREDSCQKIVKHDRNRITTKLGNECLENIRWMTSTAEGNVYLVDLYGIKKVDRLGRVYTLATQLQERKLTRAFVNDPHQLMGLSTDKDENVYVAVYGAGKVKKVTPKGKVSTVAETNLSWSPTGVLSAPNGDLWILECSPANAVRVERITRDGRRIIY